MSPNGDEVGFECKISNEVCVKVFEPLFSAVVGLENGRQKMKVSLGRIAYPDSFEGGAGRVERDFAFNQTPEKGTLQVVREVIFTTIATTKNAREGNRIMIESPAGSPVIDPWCDYLKRSMSSS